MKTRFWQKLLTAVQCKNIFDEEEALGRPCQHFAHILEKEEENWKDFHLNL